ncbi:MAG: hypothetical protein AAFR21_02290 [Pseudomonadota bacterium]
MPDQFLSRGTLGKLEISEEDEFGVVVHCWFNKTMDGYDCYVAFFGDTLPDNEPATKPYVLRYTATSLTVIN